MEEESAEKVARTRAPEAAAHNSMCDPKAEAKGHARDDTCPKLDGVPNTEGEDEACQGIDRIQESSSDSTGNDGCLDLMFDEHKEDRIPKLDVRKESALSRENTWERARASSEDKEDRIVRV